MTAVRRGKGEGSVTRRPNGRWMGQADAGWKDGKRLRKTIYGRTKREVQDKLREIVQRLGCGEAPIPEQETVASYLQRWLEDKKSEVRPRTYENYEQIVRNHLTPGLGRFRLARLGPSDVAAWLRRQEKHGVSARTRRYVRAVLRSALNQALRWELVSRNAAALTTPPRYRPREIHPLSPEQARTLLGAVSGHRLEALISVGLALGLRLGEALGLRWTDVDSDRRELAVRQTLERAGGDAASRKQLTAERRRLLDEFAATKDTSARKRISAVLADVRLRLAEVRTTVRFSEPKTTRSRRTITIPGLVVASLSAHRERQREERLAAGAKWHDSGLVFTTAIGTPLDGRNLNRVFKAILRDAGLPAIRYHDLRHTAATLLLAQGVDPRTIMETLGHSQISLTLNTYAHVVPALQREAAAKMDAILSCPVSADRGSRIGHPRPPASVRSGADRQYDRQYGHESEGAKVADSLGKSGEPPGTRTPNPQIKSLLLCQLS